MFSFRLFGVFRGLVLEKEPRSTRGHCDLRGLSDFVFFSVRVVSCELVVPDWLLGTGTTNSHEITLSPTRNIQIHETHEREISLFQEPPPANTVTAIINSARFLLVYGC